MVEYKSVTATKQNLVARSSSSNDTRPILQFAVPSDMECGNKLTMQQGLPLEGPASSEPWCDFRAANHPNYWDSAIYTETPGTASHEVMAGEHERVRLSFYSECLILTSSVL